MRDGVIAAGVGPVAVRVDFRGLAVLRAIKSLLKAGLPLARIRRELTALRGRLAQDQSLAELSLGAHDGHVVLYERGGAWRADTGQGVLDFRSECVVPILRELPTGRNEVTLEPVGGLSADAWIERAIELEDLDVTAAVAAYRKALKLRPDAGEAWINLGRLLAESGEPDAAAEAFRAALAIQPNDPTALYNLGVVAQDLGNDEEAIDLYQRALVRDALLAEAHYNLATIFDRVGDTRAAIRHINAYRKLTRKSE